MTTYITRIWKQNIGNKVIRITNLTPDFNVKKKREVKLQIEAKLYDVFCKYMSLKS